MLKRIFTVFFSSLITIVIVEFCVRMFFPMFNPTGNLVFETNSDMVRLQYRNTTRRLYKNSGDYNVAVYANSYGFRDNNEIFEADETSFFAIGDSFTFGWGVEEDERFSDILEDLLEKPLVLNIAMPTNIEGYKATVEFIKENGIFINKAIVGICMENDIVKYFSLTNNQRRQQYEKSFLYKIKAVGHKYSAAYLFTTTIVHQSEILKRFFGSIGLISKNIQYDAIPDQEAVQESILALKNLRDTLNINPVILIIPSRDIWQGENRDRAIETHNLFIQELNDNNFDYLDMMNAMEKNGEPLQYFFKNDPHWNKYGHFLAAQELYNFLKD